ncbi:MAG TPA: DUF1289 domain-containing protein [Stellaceae bacterium]|nr:DUF1289 domain-containing protein [Stellaceae bacterium]
MTGSVASPCTRMCTFDETSGLCLGCRRNLNEIMRWSTLGDDEKRRILTLLPQRGGTVPFSWD